MRVRAGCLAAVIAVVAGASGSPATAKVVVLRDVEQNRAVVPVGGHVAAGFLLLDSGCKVVEATGTLASNDKPKDKASYPSPSGRRTCAENAGTTPGPHQITVGEIRSAQISAKATVTIEVNAVVEFRGPCFYSYRKLVFPFENLESELLTNTVDGKSTTTGKLVKKGSSKTCPKKVMSHFLAEVLNELKPGPKAQPLRAEIKQKP